MEKFSRDSLYELLTKVEALSSQEGFDLVELREVLSHSMLNGEEDHIDFKRSWIESDKLAKLSIALANYGGGHIIFGVEETNNEFNPVGLKELKDKADITNELEKFIPENLIYEVNNYIYSDSEHEKLKEKQFQVLSIKSERENLPYLSTNEGKNINKNRIYTRRGTSTVEANNLEINEMLKLKTEALFSEKKTLDLKVHINQLNVLYQNIKRTKTIHVEGSLQQVTKNLQKQMRNFTGYYKEIENENYPDKSFEEFIGECITDKQKRIRQELDLD